MYALVRTRKITSTCIAALGVTGFLGSIFVATVCQTAFPHDSDPTVDELRIWSRKASNDVPSQIALNLAATGIHLRSTRELPRAEVLLKASLACLADLPAPASEWADSVRLQLLQLYNDQGDHEKAAALCLSDPKTFNSGVESLTNWHTALLVSEFSRFVLSAGSAMPAYGFCSQALDRYRNGPDRQNGILARLLMNFSELNLAIGEVEDASAAAKEAIRVAEGIATQDPSCAREYELSRESLLERCKFLLARANIALGKHEEAKEYFQTLLLQPLNEEETASIEICLADCLSKSDPQSAINLYQKVSKRDPPNSGDSTTRTRYCQLRIAHLLHQMHHLSEAREILDKLTPPFHLINPFAQDLSFPVDVALELSSVASDQKDWKTARTVLVNAISSVETALIRSVLRESEGWDSPIETMLAALWDQLYFVAVNGSLDESMQRVILELHLRCKGAMATLVAATSKALREQNNPQLLKLLKEDAALAQRITDIQLGGIFENEAIQASHASLGDLQAKRALNVGRLRREYLAPNFGAPRVLTAAPPTESAYIDFVRYRVLGNGGRAAYLAFTLVPDGTAKGRCRIIDLGDADEVDKASQELLNGLESPQHALLEQPCGLLFQLLIKKLEDEIGGFNTWFVSADGAVELTPLEVLRPTEKDQFLCDRKKIVYCDGREFFKKTPPGKPKVGENPRSMLMIAAPEFTPEASTDTRRKAGRATSNKTLQTYETSEWPPILTPLALTRRTCNELSVVASNAKYQVDIWSDQVPTKTRLLNTDLPRVLHVATHGLFINTAPDRDSSRRYSTFQSWFLSPTSVRGFDYWSTIQPRLRCGLALAGANRLAFHLPIPADGDSGILTADEVLNMDLRDTEMVVLHACESGRGFSRLDHRTESMAFAFRAAGAKVVLSGLWRVDEEASSRFMATFYERYFNGTSATDASAAARAAVRQWALTEHKDTPYYWASFRLEGVDVMHRDL